jgi:formylglycine-generating enzyme required for sulfatase activity
MGAVRRLGLVLLVAVAVCGVGCGLPGEIDVAVGELEPQGAGDALEGMVSIPTGGFLMGCNDAKDEACDADEYPYHTVLLLAFRIDVTEVTQAAYQTCVTAGACSVPAADPPECGWDPLQRGEYPVVCVTHEQARTYCAWQGKRLPTEAEWERAARGTDGRIYPWGDAPPTCSVAASSECGQALVPAGSLSAGASVAGVLDMAGNAGEWVDDWYDVDYYSITVGPDPGGPSTGAYRVIRGGTMYMTTQYLRSSNRSADEPAAQRFSVGFRCAAD